MPALFCCFKTAAAFFQSASVEDWGSTPILNRPKFAISCGSDIMPTCPAYFLSHRELMEVILSLTYFGFQAMPVEPLAHGTL